jgi:heme/copper-type cytochrome/quinol oxidase subunit 2
MDNVEKLIEMIREKEMKPKARWRFTFKNSLAWAAFLVAVTFGALAFSVILFAIQQLDFNLVAHMSHSFFELLLGLIPILWIIFLIIFLAIAIFSIKNSKKGYKFTSLSLAGFCTALSILTGTLFFISGGAGWLENVFATRIGQYESVEEIKTKVWTMPEDGYLSGTILSVGDTTFEMEDFNGKSWTIAFGEADIVPSISIVDGEKIKMTGNMTSDNTFKADKIRPWGGFQHRYHGGQEK